MSDKQSTPSPTPNVLGAYGPFGSADRKRLIGLFKGYDRISMRYFWDRIGDDSFYHGLEGDFDCADIHGYMNMIGDGDYCAV